MHSVMLIDNRDSRRADLANNLSRSGFEVHEVETGEEAWRHDSAEGIDIILMNENPVTNDCIQLARVLTTGPGHPCYGVVAVIILSGQLPQPTHNGWFRRKDGFVALVEHIDYVLNASVAHFTV